MARSRVVWTGLKEYLAELKQLPVEVQGEVTKDTEGGVNAAFVAIKRVYLEHEVTGSLARRLSIAPMKGGLVLKNTSPYAWVFDHGSKVRHWATGKSTGKMWGRTAPMHTFDRTVGKTRRELTEKFKALLKRHGAVSVAVD